jgi:hypothetical protein
VLSEIIKPGWDNHPGLGGDEMKRARIIPMVFICLLDYLSTAKQFSCGVKH